MKVKERTAGPGTTALPHAPVADIMSRDPLTLRTAMRIEDAISLLGTHGYTGAPAVDQTGALAGVLHAIDVALMHLPPRAAGPRHLLVGQVLRPAATTSPDHSAHAAAERLFSGATDRLVVVDDTDIVGLVTAHDMLRAVAQHGDLLQRVVDEVLEAHGILTASAHVGPDGTVLLSGAVDTHARRQHLLAAIGAIRGVSRVDDLLTVLGPG